MKPNHQRFDVLLLLLLLLGCIPIILEAFPVFRQKIPNGFAVPNPGPQGAFGLVSGGCGPRNPFGIDFMEDGFSWTEDLCRKDSDDVGRSNGEELGDPDCVWRIEGDNGPTPAAQTSARLHPRIVDDPVVGQDLSDPCHTYDPHRIP